MDPTLTLKVNKNLIVKIHDQQIKGNDNTTRYMMSGMLQSLQSQTIPHQKFICLLIEQYKSGINIVNKL
jgi:hypothetical protein